MEECIVAPAESGSRPMEDRATALLAPGMDVVLIENRYVCSRRRSHSLPLSESKYAAVNTLHVHLPICCTLTFLYISSRCLMLHVKPYLSADTWLDCTRPMEECIVAP
jgi:hypothetical protein